MLTLSVCLYCRTLWACTFKTCKSFGHTALDIVAKVSLVSPQSSFVNEFLGVYCTYVKHLSPSHDGKMNIFHLCLLKCPHRCCVMCSSSSCGQLMGSRLLFSL